MGKKSRTSVLKRQRELKKAEKAILKEAQREQHAADAPGESSRVATADDLEGYGLGPETREEDEPS